MNLSQSVLQDIFRLSAANPERCSTAAMSKRCLDAPSGNTQTSDHDCDAYLDMKQDIVNPDEPASLMSRSIPTAARNIHSATLAARNIHNAARTSQLWKRSVRSCFVQPDAKATYNCQCGLYLLGANDRTAICYDNRSTSLGSVYVLKNAGPRNSNSSESVDNIILGEHFGYLRRHKCHSRHPSS